LGKGRVKRQEQHVNGIVVCLRDLFARGKDPHLAEEKTALGGMTREGDDFTMHSGCGGCRKGFGGGKEGKQRPLKKVKILGSRGREGKL